METLTVGMSYVMLPAVPHISKYMWLVIYLFIINNYITHGQCRTFVQCVIQLIACVTINNSLLFCDAPHTFLLL